MDLMKNGLERVADVHRMDSGLLTSSEIMEFCTIGSFPSGSLQIPVIMVLLIVRVCLIVCSGAFFFCLPRIGQSHAHNEVVCVYLEALHCRWMFHVLSHLVSMIARWCSELDAKLVCYVSVTWNDVLDSWTRWEILQLNKRYLPMCWIFWR